MWTPLVPRMTRAAVDDVSTGVWCTRPPSEARVAWMAARVIGDVLIAGVCRAAGRRTAICVVAQAVRDWVRDRDTGQHGGRAQPLRGGRPRPRRPEAAVRPRVPRRWRGVRGRARDAGRLPGPEHEPAPRGAALGRSRLGTPRREHGLLPAR